MSPALKIKASLAIICTLNLFFWAASRDVYMKWQGVPPAPSNAGAVMAGLGDTQLSYRLMALSVQNLGDVGRDITPLQDYNYTRLGKWFYLLSALDPISDHAPMMAAYYFGATKVPSDARVIVDYLAKVGTIDLGEKWRWLAQAAFLAQHRVKDMDLALKLAYQLAKLPNHASLPQWARQMPAFILTKRGDKDAARDLMKNMLLTEKNIHPNEVNFMKDYLVDELGVPAGEVEAILQTRNKP